MRAIRQTALLILVLVLAHAMGQAQSDSESAPKRVLLLHHYGREAPAVILFDQGFENVLKTAPPARIELYRETLETYRFPADHNEFMRRYLKEKYGDRKLDVIVAFTDTSLAFVKQYRDELFPNVPVVYVVSKK